MRGSYLSTDMDPQRYILTQKLRYHQDLVERSISTAKPICKCPQCQMPVLETEIGKRCQIEDGSCNTDSGEGCIVFCNPVVAEGKEWWVCPCCLKWLCPLHERQWCGNGNCEPSSRMEMCSLCVTAFQCENCGTQRCPTCAYDNYPSCLQCDSFYCGLCIFNHRGICPGCGHDR